jgi:ubiquinone/menaquinone biosynthesis C-methylase UbiE
MKQGDANLITEVERQTWDRSAATYMRFAELAKHALPRLIHECRLTAEDHAIDIGCGPGHVTNMMAQSGAKVVGVDLSPEMVKQARSLYSSLTFQEANAERLPFEDDTFDVALINFAIHHFARPQVACAEIRRILKPQGRFVFGAPKDQFGFAAFIEAVNTHHTLDNLPHGPIYLDAEKETYEKLLADSGFQQFRVEVWQQTLHLHSIEPLLVAGWNICNLGVLPQETQDKIAATTREKAAPYKSDSGYDFPDVVFVGVAIKGISASGRGRRA